MFFNKKTDSNNTDVVKVEYIDVGQADAILIENNKKYVSTDLMKKEPVKENFISSDIELLHFRIL